jgi:hypothetical protein
MKIKSLLHLMGKGYVWGTIYLLLITIYRVHHGNIYIRCLNVHWVQNEKNLQGASWKSGQFLYVECTMDIRKNTG